MENCTALFLNRGVHLTVGRRQDADSWEFESLTLHKYKTL